MEKGFNSWVHDQQTDWQSFNMNLPRAQFGFRPRVMFPSFGNMISPPVSYEHGGWYYGFPKYREGFDPMVNSHVKEVEKKLPEASHDAGRETNVTQKKFLVFDQSGDQTTLMYSLGVGPSSTRYQFPSFNSPKPQFGSHMVNNNDGYDLESEMREDTEELNALLYSDDDEDDDNDEDDDGDGDDDETSTGHSPNSMTGFRGQKRKKESGEEEEVASCGGILKRCKKDYDGSFVNTLEDTASSGKSGINCSGNEANGMFEEEYDNFSSFNNKSRIEKMKETINVLQSLIPGDTNGKNALMVIDEAISYLRSLKMEVKTLGLDSV